MSLYSNDWLPWWTTRVLTSESSSTMSWRTFSPPWLVHPRVWNAPRCCWQFCPKGNWIPTPDVWRGEAGRPRTTRDETPPNDLSSQSKHVSASPGSLSVIWPLYLHFKSKEILTSVRTSRELSCESSPAALFILFVDIRIIAGFGLHVMNHKKSEEE